MSAATMQSTPAVPPRPTRSQDKHDENSMPAIPPRPSKRFNRSVSPNPDRFAPSPLNESPFNPKAKRLSQSFLGEELERSTSVDLPGVGQEGQEYAAIQGLGSPSEDSRSIPSSPEQTRSVGEDVKLHAPKPTVPAINAKQRVAAVTRTDSDRAATFGIGRPSSEEPLHSGRSLKKKASTLSQLSHQSEADDEHGIPEIGQRVPMLAYAGDVQAPSPAPPRAPSVDSTKSGRHHTRRSSSRAGFNELPPGSYGLHGHGVESTDKLEKAYYEKHPEKYHKEHYNHLRDRDHDYSMSSENLNKIVRDTAAGRGAGSGTSGYVGTPSEQVGYQASDEYTSRMSSPQPTGSSQKLEAAKSPLSGEFANKDHVIHVDDHGDHVGFAKYGDEPSAEGHGEHDEYEHPILAADEVAKDTGSYDLRPAVPPHHYRRQSGDEARSRPSSRPGSIYSPPPADVMSTPLDDVEEYEPLFPEGEGEKPKTHADKLKEHRQRFPSRDIWEDAPNSVHSTAEVSTPEPLDSRPKSRTSIDLPPRDTETPAQAFARRQEELAEKEATNPDAFLNRNQRPKSWAEHQPHLAKEIHSRPNTQRFPSRDIWEDTPDSLQFTTTVSHPQSSEDSPADEEEKPKLGDASFRGSQPMIPARPARKQGSGDDKPTVPGRPKPQVPARPTKSSSESSEPDAPRQKPAVPARPVGGKIAALQAGFMSDLNNRLRLGPQAPKKDAPAEEAPPEEERAPLPDARKSRARGPQRRAPTKASSPASGDRSGPPPVSNGGLTFSMTRTLFSINEEGTMTVDHFGAEKGGLSEKVEEIKPEATEAKPEVHEVEPEVAEVESEVPETKEDDEVTREEPQPSIDEPSEKETIGDAEPEVKTLATNTAGEPVVSETVLKGDGDVVKDVEDVVS